MNDLGTPEEFADLTKWGKDILIPQIIRNLRGYGEFKEEVDRLRYAPSSSHASFNEMANIVIKYRWNPHQLERVLFDLLDQSTANEYCSYVLYRIIEKAGKK